MHGLGHHRAPARQARGGGARAARSGLTRPATPGAEWREAHRAPGWFERRSRLPRRTEAEQVILDDVLRGEVSRLLDLGTGDGHLIEVVRTRWPSAAAVGLDLSGPMLEEASRRFDGSADVALREHDLMGPLPAIGGFDAIVSALALHHLPHERKRSLFREVHELLRPGGVFCNFDVVKAPEPELHEYAQRTFGFLGEQEDASDQPAPLEDELAWLRAAGFARVDCYWKWLELAVTAGTREPCA